MARRAFRLQAEGNQNNTTTVTEGHNNNNNNNEKGQHGYNDLRIEQHLQQLKHRWVESGEEIREKRQDETI